MKYIYVLPFLVSCNFILIAQTTTYTTYQKGVNPGYGGAYVPPVITKTYTIQSDPYVWDNSKSTFNTNTTYIGSAVGSGTSGSTFAIKTSAWERKRDKLAAETSRLNSITAHKNEKMEAIGNLINSKVYELAENYESGDYLEAYICVAAIRQAYTDLFNERYALYDATGSTDATGLPSEEVSGIEKFYTLLTLNKVGSDKEVLSEYLANYTNCLHFENTACYDEAMLGKAMIPPFSSACSVRECPEKIIALQGLSLEDIFVIELTFTESAALSGFIDFANANFKAIMNYYSGKIVFSSYYLDLAAVCIAMGNKEFAMNLVKEYQAGNGTTAEGKKLIGLFSKKMAFYYFSKGEEQDGMLYMDHYIQGNIFTIKERKLFITALGRSRYLNGKENKSITRYLEMQMDTLLAEKDFMAMENDYCLMLGDRIRLYMSNGQYTEAKVNMDLVAKNCVNHFSGRTYKLLRMFSGEAEAVMAQEDVHFAANEWGEFQELTLGLSEESFYYMELLNDAGYYEKSISVYTHMKDQNVKRKFPHIFRKLEGEACIAYYHLKDYKNAKEMMNDYDLTLVKYKRYWAKVYAQEGNIKKAKEIYSALASGYTIFDAEDLRIIEQ